MKLVVNSETDYLDIYLPNYFKNVDLIWSYQHVECKICVAFFQTLPFRIKWNYSNILYKIYVI